MKKIYILIRLVLIATLLVSPAYSQVSTTQLEQTQLNEAVRHFSDRVRQDFAQLVIDYDKIPDTEGGRILNSDEALKLSPAYVANPLTAEYFRKPAQEFITQLYALKLKQPLGANASVLITGGGTGAGKTTSLNRFSFFVQNSDLVVDTTLRMFDGSKVIIDQALESGRSVNVFYVYRDPVDAYVNGVLPRGIRVGRLVGFDFHVKSHIESRKVMDQLLEHYGNNPKFQLYVIDSSPEMKNIRLVALNTIPYNDPKVVNSMIRQGLANALKEGKIDQKMFDQLTVAR